jgi:hypothetical protein
MWMNPPCTLGVFLPPKMDQSTKGVVCLGNNILTWLSSSINTNSGILIGSPMAGKAGRKNNLSVAPILIFFLFLEMYFLPMNPPCTLDVFLDKKIDNQPNKEWWMVKALWGNPLPGELYYSLKDSWTRKMRIF